MVKQMHKPLSIKTNSLWNLIGNLIYALTQWGMLVVIAKYGSVEMVGIFTLGLAITAPIMLLTNLNLRVAIATDTYSEYSFGNYFALRIITLIVFYLILCLILVIGNYEIETIIVILALGLAKIIESFSDIMFGLMQKNERMDWIAISRIIKGLLSLLSLFILLWLTGNLFVSILGLLITWLIILVFYDIRNAKKFESIYPLFNKSNICLLLKLTIPLGIAQMLGSFNTTVPRYFVEFFLGAEMLGYFAAIAYIVVAGNDMIRAIGNAVVPRLAKYYANNRIKDFIYIELILVSIALIIGFLSLIFIYFFGDIILTILYTSSYGQYSSLFFLIMISGLFIYISIFLELGLLATREFFIQPYINLIILIFVLIGCVILIPLFGLEGAAYILIISGIIRLLLFGMFLIIILWKSNRRRVKFNG